MTRPPVSEFLDENAIKSVREEQARQKQRDTALRAIINVGHAIRHNGFELTWPATMVLLFVALAPEISLTQIAKWLKMSPGGVPKIIDQLSAGRMIRGERHPGLGLVERNELGGLTLTAKGEEVVQQIATPLEEVSGTKA